MLVVVLLKSLLNLLHLSPRHVLVTLQLAEFCFLLHNLMLEALKGIPQQSRLNFAPLKQGFAIKEERLSANLRSHKC